MLDENKIGCAIRWVGNGNHVSNPPSDKHPVLRKVHQRVKLSVFNISTATMDELFSGWNYFWRSPQIRVRPIFGCTFKRRELQRRQRRRQRRELQRRQRRKLQRRQRRRQRRKLQRRQRRELQRRQRGNSTRSVESNAEITSLSVSVIVNWCYRHDRCHGHENERIMDENVYLVFLVLLLQNQLATQNFVATC
jgi:hypothetical protein